MLSQCGGVQQSLLKPRRTSPDTEKNTRQNKQKYLMVKTTSPSKSSMAHLLALPRTTQKGPVHSAKADEPLWLFSKAQTDAGLAGWKVHAHDPSLDSFNGKAFFGLWVKLCRSSWFRAGEMSSGPSGQTRLLPSGRT